MELQKSQNSYDMSTKNGIGVSREFFSSARTNVVCNLEFCISPREFFSKVQK